MKVSYFDFDSDKHLVKVYEELVTPDDWTMKPDSEFQKWHNDHETGIGCTSLAAPHWLHLIACTAVSRVAWS